MGRVVGRLCVGGGVGGRREGGGGGQRRLKGLEDKATERRRKGGFRKCKLII